MDVVRAYTTTLTNDDLWPESSIDDLNVPIGEPVVPVGALAGIQRILDLDRDRRRVVGLVDRYRKDGLGSRSISDRRRRTIGRSRVMRAHDRGLPPVIAVEAGLRGSDFFDHFRLEWRRWIEFGGTIFVVKGSIPRSLVRVWVVSNQIFEVEKVAVVIDIAGFDFRLNSRLVDVGWQSVDFMKISRRYRPNVDGTGWPRVKERLGVDIIWGGIDRHDVCSGRWRSVRPRLISREIFTLDACRARGLRREVGTRPPSHALRRQNEFGY